MRVMGDEGDRDCLDDPAQPVVLQPPHEQQLVPGEVEGQVCRMQAEDRAFADVLTIAFPTAPGLRAEWDRSARQQGELLKRAKATGHLRADFVHQDVPLILILILMANVGVVNATRDAAPEAWRQLVGSLIQAFAAEAAAPLPKAPSKDQIYNALMRVTEPK